MNVSTVLLLIYLTMTVGVILGEILGLPYLSLAAKTLAMPSLLGRSWQLWEGPSTKKYLLGSILLFSWIGDVLLIFAPDPNQEPTLIGISRHPFFFIGGLGSFLIAQLLYIRAFMEKPVKPPIGFPRWGYFFILGYGVGMILYLWKALSFSPEKSSLRLPVVLYSVALLSMLASTASQKGRVNPRAFWMSFTGAVSFVLSDSLIGLNYLAWEKPMWGAGAWIFGTYAIAQFLLTEGLREKAKGTETPIYENHLTCDPAALRRE
ncbi:MAG: lysoplasmalogenase [Bacteroidia bacterium]|nr:lysoplasmalogenase [Bacteroidia bacterium]